MRYLLRLCLLLLLFGVFIANSQTTSCFSTTTCFTAEDCKTDESNVTSRYCAGPCGGPGRCVAISDDCDATSRTYAVCGCDGNSYESECQCRKSGIEVEHIGVCTNTNTTTTTTRCTSSNDCDQTQFCSFESGTCGGSGTCRKRPEACTEQYDPVCGCDNKTYGNACAATSHGISILHSGECDIFPPESCESDEDCEDDLYCQYQLGQCGGQGSCVLQEDFCTKEYNPVCGCDGNTYGNPCMATGEGVSVLYYGECKSDVSCENDKDCEENHFCEYVAGECGGNGTCQERSLGCTREYNPVCGCDGNNYGNPCTAASNGISVLYFGQCFDDSVSSCESDDDCKVSEYCAYDKGVCGGNGSCEIRAEACTFQYEPVCGCDGNTYGNDCAASSEGVSVAYSGECKAVVVSCENNDDCENNTFCGFSIGFCNGSGTCSPRLQICNARYNPVCGCDGKTYGNPCSASSNGVSILNIGECKTTCKSDEDCLNNNNTKEFCLFEEGTCGGEGICSSQPKLCSLIYSPVCGCNGKTYGSECAAKGAGVSIDYIGECTQSACDSGNCTICKQDSDCMSDEFCELKIGDCNLVFIQAPDGNCVKKGGSVCPDIYQPVCGCNGKTYPNKCFAQSSGVSLSSEGTCIKGCNDKNSDCNSTCISDTDCGDLQFCQFPTGSCNNIYIQAPKGTCMTTQGVCFDIARPVCGCNGITYSNECYARLAGVSISSEGSCTSSCSSNDDCNLTYYCLGQCNASNKSIVNGHCVVKPKPCTLVNSPVCGCDGKTYSSECTAAASGVSVSKHGACTQRGLEFTLDLKKVLGNITGNISAISTLDLDGDDEDSSKSIHLNYNKQHQSEISFIFQVPEDILSSLNNTSKVKINFIRLEMNFKSNGSSDTFWKFRVRLGDKVRLFQGIGNNGNNAAGKWIAYSTLLKTDASKYITTTGEFIFQLVFEPTKSACTRHNRVCAPPSVEYARAVVNYDLK